MNWKVTIIICLVILLAAGGVLFTIYQTEPVAQRINSKKQTAMLVETITPEYGDFRPHIVATGTVRPEKEITLSPRVSGQILELSESFTPGGFVKQGEVLLIVDPTDYEVSLKQRQSELQQATANLQMELGRQDLARRDYEELEGTISDVYKTLVLRQPQLDAAEAEVASAEAAVRRAEADLQRTKVRAPFDAHVLSREANLGSQVSPGQALANLVGVKTYWVEANLPVADLQWIVLPQSSSLPASSVSVRNRVAWPDGLSRDGEVHGLIGALESQTRMARVLLSVPDPLAHEPESSGLPPLMVGSFVEVSIEGRPIQGVYRLPREYLRQNDTVWLNESGVLRIRELNILFRDKEFVYLKEGLERDSQLVITNLATVREGASLRYGAESL